MADYPALPLWTDAYLADTRHLTTEQHGAYLLILMEMWRRPDCALPLDHAFLIRVTGVSSRKWPLVWRALSPLFQKGKTKFQQKRLTKERNFVEEKSNKNSRAARARWLKSKEKPDANAMPNACQTDAPTPTPTPTPIYTDVTDVTSDPLRGSRSKAVFDTHSKVVFDTGIKLLAGYGITDSAARALIGRWRRSMPDHQLLGAMTQAGAARRTDIVAYMAAIIRADGRDAGGDSGDSGDSYQSHLGKTLKELHKMGWKA